MAKPTPARFVAADASPLIGLATADAFHLLQRLFGTITITRAVKDEVTAGGALPGVRELNAAMHAGWIRVAPTPLTTWKLAELDAGEASTIALALQHGGGALVLMDDTRGRAQAAALELEVTGTAGVLRAAHHAGLIDDLQPYLRRLAHRGFVIPDDAP